MMAESLSKFLYIFFLTNTLAAQVNITNVSATSTLVEKEKTSDFYSSRNLIDNSYKSWAEGVDGDGINESISFEFETPVDIKGLGIRNGYGDLRLYFQNNRVKFLKISVNDSYKGMIRIADTPDLYNYDLFRFEDVKKIRFTIKGVYKGAKYSDTCINEIYFYTDFDYASKGYKDTKGYQEDYFTKKIKKEFASYSQQFDTLIYNADGIPFLLHPVDPPCLTDIWCFNDMEFYSYQNGSWILDNSNPAFSLIKKDIEQAKKNGFQILFSFEQVSGYAGTMYGYVLKVTAPSETVFEYDFDGYIFRQHDIEWKDER